MLIDATTEYGQRVSRRLSEEHIGWFTTVSKDGTPHPRPVWFLWNGESFLIFSQLEGHKVRHLEDNSKVALHLNGDQQGGDIIVFLGEARVDIGPLDEADLEAYIKKYRQGFERIGLSPETFSEKYPTAIRMTPTRLRGH